MKNILKSTVALPFKFLKGIMEMMKAILNSILKLFGHPGIGSGGEHTARVEKPEDAHSSDDVAKKAGMSNKPEMEFAKKIVNEQTLSNVKEFVNSDDRTKFDMSKLSASMKVYISSLSATKIEEMKKLSDADLRTQIITDLSELRARQKQMMKADKVQETSADNDQDSNTPKPESKLKQRIAAAKNKQNAPAYKAAFAM